MFEAAYIASTIETEKRRERIKPTADARRSKQLMILNQFSCLQVLWETNMFALPNAQQQMLDPDRMTNSCMSRMWWKQAVVVAGSIGRDANLLPHQLRIKQE